jgi:hypothetical protein
MAPNPHSELPLASDSDPADFAQLLVPLKRAFHALGVGPTKGYELIAAGHLTRVKIGGKSLITADSLRRFVAGLLPAR